MPRRSGRPGPPVRYRALVYVIPLTYRPDVTGTLYGHRVSSALASTVLVVVTWLVVIGAALLVLRAVVSEELDREQDQSDDEVSGHVPSE